MDLLHLRKVIWHHGRYLTSVRSQGMSWIPPAVDSEASRHPDDVGPFSGQSHRGGGADPARGPGDQGHPAGKLGHSESRPP